ncbi:MAG: hypothetical protein R3B47_17805 [Bacteroidia bacterium]
MLGEIIGEIIVELLFKTILWGIFRLLLLLMHHIGASAKWLWFQGKRPYIMNENGSGTAWLGFFIFIVLVGLIIAMAIYL